MKAKLLNAEDASLLVRGDVLMVTGIQRTSGEIELDPNVDPALEDLDAKIRYHHAKADEALKELIKIRREGL